LKALTPEQLQARRQAAAPLLLDVRQPWEFELARIEGSMHLPMHEVPRRHGELDPSGEIVVICHHGMRSAQVTQYLDQLGFKNVYNLSGGIDAWSRQIDLKVPLY
jgi:rhodanese-related sulfurtransferase